MPATGVMITILMFKVSYFFLLCQLKPEKVRHPFPYNIENCTLGEIVTKHDCVVLSTNTFTCDSIRAQEQLTDTEDLAGL